MLFRLWLILFPSMYLWGLKAEQYLPREVASKGGDTCGMGPTDILRWSPLPSRFAETVHNGGAVSSHQKPIRAGFLFQPQPPIFDREHHCAQNHTIPNSPVWYADAYTRGQGPGRSGPHIISAT